jgi:hypothetical protein
MLGNLKKTNLVTLTANKKDYRGWLVRSQHLGEIHLRAGVARFVRGGLDPRIRGERERLRVGQSLRLHHRKRASLQRKRGGWGRFDESVAAVIYRQILSI